MRLTRGKQKLTLILIRDPDKPVRRAGTPRFLVYLLTALLLTFIASVVGWQIILHQRAAVHISELSAVIRQSDSTFDDMVDTKEAEIDDLKSEIVHFTEQTESIRNYYEHLKTMEEDIQKLLQEIDASQPEPLKAQRIVGIAQAQPTAAEKTSMGGQDKTVSPDQWNAFLLDTHDSLKQLMDEMTTMSDQLEQTKVEIKERINMLKTAPDFWPTTSAVITSNFGVRSDPFTGRAAFHEGLDVAGDIGDPVFAAADGKVVAIGHDAFKGKYVQLEHDQGIRTMYMHLNKIIVGRGDSVTKGQQIAEMGNTGRSSGPHLHFEISVDGQPIDPMLLLEN